MTTNFQFRVVTETDGPDLADIDGVGIHFDRIVPTHINEPLTFLLDIKCGNRRSSIRFSIGLTRFAGADLQRLHDFLAQRHSGVRDDYTFARSLAWLLTLSMRQQGETTEQIDARVRELLLTRND
jgi:hypothetical protein